MIRRSVEYYIRCDGPDCNESLVWGARTRKQCEEEAPSNGWTRFTRGRWLCKTCAEKMLPPSKKIKPLP
jgi:hypothetical protein